MKTEEIRKIKELEGVEIPNFEEFNNSQLTERYTKKYYYDFWNFLENYFTEIGTWKEKYRLFREQFGDPMKEEDKYLFKIVDGKEIKVPNIKYYKGGLFREKLIKSRFPEFWNCVQNKYPEIKYFNEKSYLFLNDLSEPPRCSVCGNKVSFIGIIDGYRKFCGGRCASIGTRDISAKTFEAHYGKGVTVPMKSKEIREQIKQICIEKFGVNNPMKNKSIQKKSAQTKKDKFVEKHDWLIGYTEDSKYICKCTHPNEVLYDVCKNCPRNFIISSDDHYNRRKHHTEICTKINPISYNVFESDQERTIQNMLKSLNINIAPHNWDLIKGFNNKKREIDIFLPDYNIGIEVNGSYVHSISYYNGGKIFDHFEKRIQCENKGVELIYIWSDWNADDIFNFLKDKLEGNDLTKYKELWFPDLKENEWPLDLGKINKEGIVNVHFCMHDKFLCIDSGILVTPPYSSPTTHYTSP